MEQTDAPPHTPAQGGRGEEPMRRYDNRDPAALEPYYSWHVQAMTEEGLHAKSAIAAELAFRDAEITALRLNCKVHQRAFREQREVAQDAGEKLFRAREELATLRTRLEAAEEALRAIMLQFPHRVTREPCEPWMQKVIAALRPQSQSGAESEEPTT